MRTHDDPKGVRALVVLSAGFAEAGDDGRALQDRVLRIVREHDMRMVGPNCLGVVNTDPEVRLNAIFGRPVATWWGNCPGAYPSRRA